MLDKDHIRSTEISSELQDRSDVRLQTAYATNMLLRSTTPTINSSNAPREESFDIESELHRRLIINLGRGVGASRLATQTLLQGAADDPALRQELLEGIDDQLRELNRLLDNLMQFDALRHNSLHLEMKPVNLQKWLPLLLAKWRPIVLREGLVWREELALNSLPVHADAECLAQVLVNLLSNALHYTPKGGQVLVGSGATRQDAWISIHNSGPGLSAAERHRLFDPFFASSHQGRFPRGVGLGLAVAAGLVQAQNGRIQVESESGQGCSFRIWLPLTRPPR